MSNRGPRMNDFEEQDYYGPPRRSQPQPEFEEYDRRRVVTRSPPPRPRETDRTPAFLRDDARRNEAGPMVLRQREVETYDRHRRTPSPVRMRQERIVHRPRSVSPPRRAPPPPREVEERSRTRFVERERVRSPSVERRRSPSPRPRYPEPPRSDERERIRTRIIDRQRERSLSSSSSSSHEPPKPVRGPTIERDVITHYRDIDHGMIKARQPSPPPIPRQRVYDRERERETDIDISLSKNKTEVDIYRSSSRSRSRPRYRGDELVVQDRSRQRAHSAAPVYSPMEDEGREITRKIDSRGYPGEAYHGATRKWEIIDVPPGTERVRMDGAGGGATDTQWSKYSGVRRTKFIPERDEGPRESSRDRDRDRERDRNRGRTNVDVDVEVYDRNRDLEVDVDVDIDRRYKYGRPPAPPPPPAPPSKEMWTEISKDLVVKEAIQEMGYEYEDTPMFYYIMKYLRYDDVLQLVELSEEIRRYRKDRVREIQYERDWRDDWERRHRHQYYRRPEYDQERIKEREVVYDSRRPYYR